MAQIVDLSSRLVHPAKPRTIESALLDDLAELDRLTCTQALNPIFKTSINKIALTFRSRVAGLLAPLREGHLQQLKEDCLEPEQLSELSLEDLRFLRESRGESHLNNARAEIKRMLLAVLADSRYARAIEAYRNQEGSVEARTTLDRFLRHHGFSEIPAPADGLLYYGLAELAGADGEYNFEQLQKIARQGIAAIATIDNLPGLESIPCSLSAEEAPGAVVLRFCLPGEKLWQRDGLPHPTPQMMRPLLKTSFDLLIKADLQAQPAWPNLESHLQKTFLAAGLPCNIIHCNDARASA